MQIIHHALQGIGYDILAVLQDLPRGTIHQKIVLQNYHGFGKAPLPEEFFLDAISLRGFASSEVQIEIVCVKTDLQRELHLHKESTAWISCLGCAEDFPDPVSAQGFLGERWFGLAASAEIIIPPSTIHGFTVAPNGMLFFLSVQSPPIVGQDGRDDYVHADGRGDRFTPQVVGFHVSGILHTHLDKG